ncbi:5-oxoprolinase subunit B family protein [Leifsonia sp. Leaf264]|uniref:5-oxoprolinase subunit B family protein n=1 Tax=Leifsonia sp. Leaf264 TaxID=1736314 RepID=UPI0006FD234D|nr:allophanate hydrolase subunit 1 [Leifsonia sp. Leaf264]KQO97409.1 allophanate hydrolase [Leifsonia sp. Leaf264]
MSPADAATPGGAKAPRFLPMGDRALLIELDSLDAVLALHSALQPGRPGGVIDLVPAARTVLVTVDPAQLSLSEARRWVEGAAAAPFADVAAVGTNPVVIPMRYDGPDLASLAAALELRPAELVERHLAATWRVAFSGFAPGFGYLVSADWTFDVPRLASPRTRVPAGSVGLAGEFSGVYPRSSPGGWQLIGTTEAVLWNPEAASPALLIPGGTVRFEAVP